MTEQGEPDSVHNELIPLHPSGLKESSIELRRQELALQREEYEFLQEKAKGEIELKNIQREQDIQMEMSKIQLATVKSNYEIVQLEKAEFYRHQRQLSTRSSWFKMLVSTILLGSGVWLIAKGDNLGPYLLGTGAGGAGIQSATELIQKKGKNDLDSLNTESQEEKSE